MPITIDISQIEGVAHVSIKMRLLLSYLGMTFIPVLLFALIVAALMTLFFNSRLDGGSASSLPAFWDKANERDDLIAGVKFMARTDPGRFGDAAFVRDTDRLLNESNAGLVIMDDDRISYATPMASSVDLRERLLELSAEPREGGWGGLRLGDRFSVQTIELPRGEDGTRTVYILSDLNPFHETARKIFPLLILSLLAVIGLTNGILTFLVSRSLIRPLNALKQAARKIKDGDLSEKVELRRKDEIGQLGEAFEEMRGRLSESIRLQLRYEDNRKELISNISHDLKTPITGIKACLEGIRDGIADTAGKREKYLGMIEKKTDDMDRLIDELFLFSKLDLKRLPFVLEPTNLVSYLRDYAEELRLEPRMKDVSVELETPYREEGAVNVLADREKLHRVLMNIVDNSLKYMKDPTKKIRIAVVDGKDEATVTIEDNGSGIEAAALPSIFDRFYRAEPSRNTAAGGSGLGLAIVKQIVEGQCGRVWAESAPGEGTRIGFTLRKVQDGGEQS